MFDDKNVYLYSAGYPFHIEAVERELFQTFGLAITKSYSKREYQQIPYGDCKKIQRLIDDGEISSTDKVVVIDNVEEEWPEFKTPITPYLHTDNTDVIEAKLHTLDDVAHLFWISSYFGVHFNNDYRRYFALSTPRNRRRLLSAEFNYQSSSQAANNPLKVILIVLFFICCK